MASRKMHLNKHLVITIFLKSCLLVDRYKSQKCIQTLKICIRSRNAPNRYAQKFTYYSFQNFSKSMLTKNLLFQNNSHIKLYLLFLNHAGILGVSLIRSQVTGFINSVKTRFLSARQSASLITRTDLPPKLRTTYIASILSQGTSYFSSIEPLLFQCRFFCCTMVFILSTSFLLQVSTFWNVT